MWPLPFTAHRSGRARAACWPKLGQRRSVECAPLAQRPVSPSVLRAGSGARVLTTVANTHCLFFFFFTPPFQSRNLRYPALWESAVGAPAAAGIIISRRSRLFFFDPFFCFCYPWVSSSFPFLCFFPVCVLAAGACACVVRRSPDDDAVLAVSRGVAMTVSALPARRGHGWRGAAGGGCTGILPTTTTRSSFGSSVCAQRSVVPSWLLA